MCMKQLGILLIAIIVGGTISCNQAEEKKEPNKTTVEPKAESTQANDTTKICEYYVDEQTGMDMINDFLFRYKKNGTSQVVRGLTTELWVDSCVFTALRNFFDTADRNYDGIRIFHTGKVNSGLLFVPTSSVLPPSMSNQHMNRYDAESRINLRTNCGSTIAINKDEYTSDSLINDFGGKFRNEPMRGNRASSKHDSLSAGVWFAKCKIQHIARLLEDPANRVNGMIVYEAAYLRRQLNDLEIGQKHDRQSTLILVPGMKTGSTYKPNWRVVTAPTQALAEQVKLGGFDHGSLCPNICN